MADEFRPEKDEALRKQILDLAENLFISYGYSSTTTEQIANGLGISKKTLYRLFSRKEDVLFAVIHRSRNEFKSRIVDVLGISSASFIDKAIKLADLYSSFIVKAPAHYYRDIQRFDPDWEKDSGTSRLIEEFFREGVQNGYIRSDIDIHLLLVYMHVSIRNMVSYSMTHPNEFSVPVILDVLPKLIIDGVLTEKGRKSLGGHA